MRIVVQLLWRATSHPTHPSCGCGEWASEETSTRWTVAAPIGHAPLPGAVQPPGSERWWCRVVWKCGGIWTLSSRVALAWNPASDLDWGVQPYLDPSGVVIWCGCGTWAERGLLDDVTTQFAGGGCTGGLACPVFVCRSVLCCASAMLRKLGHGKYSLIPVIYSKTSHSGGTKTGTNGEGARRRRLRIPQGPRLRGRARCPS